MRWELKRRWWYFFWNFSVPRSKGKAVNRGRPVVMIIQVNRALPIKGWNVIAPFSLITLLFSLQPVVFWLFFPMGAKGSKSEGFRVSAMCRDCWPFLFFFFYFSSWKQVVEKMLQRLRRSVLKKSWLEDTERRNFFVKEERFFHRPFIYPSTRATALDELIGFLLRTKIKTEKLQSEITTLHNLFPHASTT